MKAERRRYCYSVPLFCFGLAILVFSVHIQICQALTPGEIPRSTEITAGLRVVASMEPDEKIRNPDYLAKEFLAPEFWFFGPLSKDFKKSKLFLKFYRLSAYYSINAGTFHVDTILEAFAKKDLKQVVIIGAGLDGRSFRFADQMPQVRFFEIDRPPVMERREKTAKRLFGKMPETITSIPVDCREQEVFGLLRLAGYKEDLKTLFIWMGGSSFSQKTVVDATLRSIASHSSPGSEMVFDYIPGRLAQGDFSKYRGARFGALVNDASGEPWRFGIAEDKSGEFFTQRGFKVISDLNAKELAEKYLVKSDGSQDGKPTSFYRIMHASVGR